MRTVSAQPRKGQERPRSLIQDARLLADILSAVYGYLIRGRRIRRAFHRCRRDGRQFYVEDSDLP